MLLSQRKQRISLLIVIWAQTFGCMPISTFRRNTLPPSSGSEWLFWSWRRYIPPKRWQLYKTTRRHNPECHNAHCYRREYLKFRTETKIVYQLSTFPCKSLFLQTLLPLNYWTNIIRSGTKLRQYLWFATDCPSIRQCVCLHFAFDLTLLVKQT